MSAVIETEGLTKTYGRRGRGIEDVDLEVRDGEVFGFLGPNGVGKTTTIRTLLNFLRTQNSATMSATVTNNTVNINDSSTANALRADTNFSAGGNATLCLDASGNTLNATGDDEISLNEIQGILNVEQASLAALASADPGSTAIVDNGTPQFGVACAEPPP